jgi:arabinofuranosyltransferase
VNLTPSTTSVIVRSLPSPRGKPWRKGRLVFWGLLTVAFALAVVGQVHFLNMTFDDAFISFRYASNLARGHGLVYTPGERVEGYSNFLWTVLLTIPTWLGAGRYEFGMLLVSKAIGLCLSLATLVCLVQTASLGRPEDEQHSAPVAALTVALSSPFLVWGVGALETPLLAFLLTLTVYLYLREERDVAFDARAFPWSSVTLLLAALTRPEPVILLVPLVAMSLLERLRQGQGWTALRQQSSRVITFGFPYGLFLGWRFFYYGELLPNTYYAKVYGDPLTTMRGWAYLASALENLNWTVLAIAAFCPIVLSRRFTHRVVVVAACFTTLSAAVVFEGGDWMPAYRMLAPTMPLVGLIVHEGWLATGKLQLSHLSLPRVPNWVAPPAWIETWQRLIARVVESKRANVFRGLLRSAGRVALVLAILVGTVNGWKATEVRGFTSALHGLRLDGFVHFRIARWMRQNVDEPGLLAIGEAGVIPYYTELPVLDMFGLLDAHIAHLPGIRHQKFDVNYVLDRRPRYVLLLVYRDDKGRLGSNYPHGRALLKEPRFHRDYATLKDFGSAILYQRSVTP